MVKQRDGKTERCRNREMEKQMDRRMKRQKEETEKWRNRLMGRQRNKEM
jgi:hypothetical protein